MLQRILLVLTFLLATSPVFAFEVPGTHQEICYDSAERIFCPAPGTLYYGQDGNYRSTPRTYTKLDDQGNDLPLSALNWTSVRDNVTNLVWEVKTTDGSVHDSTWLFKRCDTNSDTNGGESGTCDVLQAQSIWGDSEAFINELNTSNFGGFNDWRVPSAYELYTLVHRDSIAGIEWLYFQHTLQEKQYYLTSTYHISQFHSGAVSIGFKLGDSTSNAQDSYPVRAVRGIQLAPADLLDNLDTTVTDQTTGLMWQKNTGTEANNNRLFTWYQALSYCENLQQANHDDWRMPNVNELLTITDYSRYQPALNTNILEGSSYGFTWTSTTIVENPQKAWLVNNSDGELNYGFYKASSSYIHNVRCVRGGTSTEPHPLKDFTIQVIGNGKVHFSNLNSDITFYDCDGQCTYQVKEGVQVKLAAMPNTGNALASWSDDCADSSQGECWVDVNSDKLITVTFSSANGDLNGDGRRGLEEVIMILQEQAGN